MDEITLNHIITLPVDQQDSLSLNARSGLFEREYNLLVTTGEDDKFQRLSIYSNGVIVSEEVTSNGKIFRFNVPFSREGNTVYLQN